MEDSISASDILQSPTLHLEQPPTISSAPGEDSLPGSMGEPSPQTQPRLPPIGKNSVHPALPQGPTHDDGVKESGWQVPVETGEYEYDENISDLLNMLECPICLDTAEKSPIYQCPEGHLLCEDCNGRLTDCPQCGHALLNSRNRTAEGLAQKLQTLRGTRRDILVPTQSVHISVSEPRKERRGLFSYVVYQLSTKTGSEAHTAARYKVCRKYTEIVKLYENLVREYQADGIIIPPPPAKNRLATIAIKMRSEPLDLDSSVASQAVSKRCVALDRYLKRMAKHPVIRKDPNFRAFIQDNEIPKAILKGVTMTEKLAKLTGNLWKSPFSNQEHDPWFQTKMSQLNTLTKQMRQLEKNLGGMAAQKYKLAQQTRNFQAGLAALSMARSGSDNLNQVLQEVIQCHKTMADMQEEQATADEVLQQLAIDYQDLIVSVKATLKHRSRYQKTMQKVQKTKKNPLEEIEKIQHQFDKISQTIRRELEHFDLVMRDEFESVFKAYNTRYWASLATSQEVRSRLNTAAGNASTHPIGRH